MIEGKLYRNKLGTVGKCIAGEENLVQIVLQHSEASTIKVGDKRYVNDQYWWELESYDKVDEKPVSIMDLPVNNNLNNYYKTFQVQDVSSYLWFQPKLTHWPALDGDIVNKAMPNIIEKEVEEINTWAEEDLVPPITSTEYMERLWK